jgi:hypothetical protein
MSFFQKSKILLKKHYIIHFFGVRMRHLRDLTFMLWFGRGDVVTCRPLCGGLHVRMKVRIKGPKVVKVVFRKSWFAIFGDDLNFFVGGERDWIIQYNIIYII